MILQRFVHGPYESAHSVHWSIPFSMGVYRSLHQDRILQDQSLDYVINVPTHGVYIRRIRGREIRIDPGQAVMSNRGECSSSWHLGGGGHCGIYLRLIPAVVPLLLDQAEIEYGPDPHRMLSSDGPVLTPELSRAWFSLWRDVCQGMTDDELYDRAIDLCLLLLQAGAPQRRKVRTSDRRKVHMLQQALIHAPGTQRSLDVLAAELGWSRFQLCRRFRAVTGQTVHSYREQLRLALAVELLEDPGLDLSMLAHRLGYSSHSHFTARFTHRMGFSPSKMQTWRRTDLLRVQSAAQIWQRGWLV